MRFRYYKTSEMFDECDFYVELNTLEELLALNRQEGRAFILFCDTINHEWVLEVYDDYRE
jgi:hypothetical protein